MRILFLASRELNYQRLDVLLRAYQRLGQVTVIGYSKRASLVKRSIQVSLRAIPYLLSGQYDLVFVGFYGHFLMLPVGLLSRRPVLFDAFLSTYDTLCFDRKKFEPASLAGRSAYRLDRVSCQLARTVLLDTEHHVDYFSRTFKLPKTKFYSLPVGCNEELFHPSMVAEAADFRVLYYCSYMPLHGADIVVKAAEALKSLPIKFRLIGTGPQYALVRSYAEAHQLTNVEFISDIPLHQLPNEIASAQLCLGGHFGVSGKAGRVIPGKIYQILAMARPLIATDTPANKEILTSQETAWLCQPGDPASLADAINELYHREELRQQLRINGYRLYQTRCSEAQITRRLRSITELTIQRIADHPVQKI